MIIHNCRFLVSLAFPALKEIEVFKLPIMAAVILPDYSIEFIKNMFDKLVKALCESSDDEKNIELDEKYMVADVMEEIMEVGKPHSKQSFTPIDCKKGFLGFIEEGDIKKIKLEPDSDIDETSQPADLVESNEELGATDTNNQKNMSSDQCQSKQLVRITSNHEDLVTNIPNMYIQSPKIIKIYKLQFGR